MKKINWIISTSLQVPDMTEIAPLMSAAMGMIILHQTNTQLPSLDVIQEKIETTALQDGDPAEESISPSLFETEKKSLVYSGRVECYPRYWLEINLCSRSTSIHPDHPEVPTSDHYEVMIGEVLETTS